MVAIIIVVKVVIAKGNIFEQLKIACSGGTWVAELIEGPTLAIHSSHDLRVVRLSPTGSTLSGESA